jgi:hypothetical protein
MFLTANLSWVEESWGEAIGASARGEEANVRGSSLGSGLLYQKCLEAALGKVCPAGKCLEKRSRYFRLSSHPVFSCLQSLLVSLAF